MRAHPILSHARFEGQRVELVSHASEHAERAFQLLHGNEEILRWLVWNGPRSQGELEAFYGQWLRSSDDACDYDFALIEKESRELVGSVGLHFIGHPGTADIGYWLGRPYWGQGYMSEGLRLLIDAGFGHLGAEVFQAHVFAGNERSRTLLERVGFRALPGAAGEDRYFTLLPGDWERSRGDWAPAAVELQRS